MRSLGLAVTNSVNGWVSAPPCLPALLRSASSCPDLFGGFCLEPCVCLPPRLGQLIWCSRARSQLPLLANCEITRSIRVQSYGLYWSECYSRLLSCLVSDRAVGWVALVVLLSKHSRDRWSVCSVCPQSKFLLLSNSMMSVLVNSFPGCSICY
jgi:hypothetical protein